MTNPALAQALQDEVKTHRDEIAELEGERDKIDRRLVELRRRETALEQARLLLLPPSETNGNGHGLSKRDAVLGYLSERPGKRVSFEEIFTALVERNQIAGDRRTRKTLQMTLSMLYKEKRVKRPEVATYMLVVPPMGAAEQNGSGSKPDQKPGSEGLQPSLPAPNTLEGATGVVYRTGL